MNSSSPTTNTRRPCFIEEDNGLASLAEMKAEFSANTYYNTTNNKNHTALHRKRSSSLRNLASLHGVLSPRSAAARLYFDARHEDQQQQQQPYFLDACFLCKKPLGDRDIFMYRGDTPFCSEECRQEQIEMDEAKEKSLNLSASMKALSKKDQRRSTSPNNCTFHTSTVAAA